MHLFEPRLSLVTASVAGSIANDAFPTAATAAENTWPVLLLLLLLKCCPGKDESVFPTSGEVHEFCWPFRLQLWFRIVGTLNNYWYIASGSCRGACRLLLPRTLRLRVHSPQLHFRCSFAVVTPGESPGSDAAGVTGLRGDRKSKPETRGTTAQ